MSSHIVPHACYGHSLLELKNFLSLSKRNVAPATQQIEHSFKRMIPSQNIALGFPLFYICEFAHFFYMCDICFL